MGAVEEEASADMVGVDVWSGSMLWAICWYIRV